MIIIEISDESILFLIQFLVFSIVVGWFIVQWTLGRDAKKRRENDE